MLGFTGIYKGKKITVIGSGMGLPSMGIYSWELYYYFNVEKIIRIGTCGVVDKSVQIPELILATKSYSESNFAYTFDNYQGHITYPSKDLNDKIIQTAQQLNYKIHVGDVTTMDVFGPYIDYDRVLNRIPKDIHPLGEEMESYGLFHIAAHFHKEAACILTAVDSKFSNIILSSEDRQTSLNDMISLALESIIL